MQAKAKNKLRLVGDACLTALLLCLMAYQVTGETLHEWADVGITAVLILHHVLNTRWYGALFKGKYNAFRVISTAVNMLLLMAIALTAFCGMSMSSHAVPFLYGMLPVAFARRFHLAMSFWSFVLMGLHLGLHLPAMTAKIKPGRTAGALITCVFALAAGLGLHFFLVNRIPDYIFFRTPFAFLDYEKPAVFIFLENISELFFFVFLGASIVRLLRHGGREENVRKARLAALFGIVLVVLTGILMPSGQNTFLPDWMQTASPANSKCQQSPLYSRPEQFSG